jgi:hypothetical protein
LLGFWNININVSFLKTVWKTLCWETEFYEVRVLKTKRRFTGIALPGETFCRVRVCCTFGSWAEDSAEMNGDPGSVSPTGGTVCKWR